ncbi:ClpXP adapter SpxH family protein [Halalkalibacter nanhaiisediminis]|uniref:ClpXP adapter protein SpxH n=1 Tax=Halalkalibacter nanhaiisediminis TaxID=688079 RepID=A0A562Q996_9BACI|nr:ClpXP adapter SpxH family protein [Halalkalibacter nanhaiisediminis]TWI53289.1 putative DsbA family dithiol-disulfide isomerase [Halalkalibacter nanhaiisediminis]
MNQKNTPTTCDNQLGVCGLDPKEKFEVKRHKPIELYTFIDPLCAECWAFEPILKKLQVEYGKYFRIRTLVAGRLKAWNMCKDTQKGLAAKKQEIASIWEQIAAKSRMSCDGDVWLENEWSSPYLVSIAIKAAELQGPQAGSRYLRKLREALFLEKQNITEENVLLKCAEQSGLDYEEFKKDLTSQGAIKALQCDITTTNEMEVDIVPTFVFFNDNIEEDGIKVTGDYPYHVYVQILEEMLGFKPEPAPSLSIEEFLAQYHFVATIEVAVVFDLTEEEAERRLKALMLQQKVESVPVKYGTFWRNLHKTDEQLAK